jgi:hypothetical protein
MTLVIHAMPMVLINSMPRTAYVHLNFLKDPNMFRNTLLVSILAGAACTAIAGTKVQQGPAAPRAPAAFPPGPSAQAFPPGPSAQAFPPGPSVNAVPPGPSGTAFPPGPSGTARPRGAVGPEI